MSKYERVFYFSAVVLEFALILFLGIKLIDIKGSKLYDNIPCNRLHSFFYKSLEGEESVVLFTGYSDKYYIFVTSATECGHCAEFIEKMGAFYNELKPDTVKIFPYVITTGSAGEMSTGDATLKVLKLSWKDSIQFGFETPVLFVVNGAGDVLYMHKGYFEGIFEKAVSIIEKSRYKKSESVQ